MYKTYILTVTPRADIDRVGNLVQTDRRIVGYWNYLPFVFCLKTEMTAKEIADLFADAAVHSLFVVEIDPRNMSGRLPRGAWGWFTEPVEAEEALAPGFREP
jgi:hypothetical protein